MKIDWNIPVCEHRRTVTLVRSLLVNTLFCYRHMVRKGGKWESLAIMIVLQMSLVLAIVYTYRQEEIALQSHCCMAISTPSADLQEILDVLGT